MDLNHVPQTPVQSLATIPEHVLSQEVDGEVVILDLQSGAYHGLNEVGARIWSLIQSCATLEEIVDVLLKEYDTELDTLRADLQAYIHSLVEAKLITLRNGTYPQDELLITKLSSTEQAG